MNKVETKYISGDFAVTVPVFGIGIIFSFSQSNRKIESIIRRCKISGMPTLLPETDTAKGVTYVNGSSTALIVVKQWTGRASGYNTLQHEIFHACDITLRNLGLKLSDDSAESWAYMIGFVTESAYQILWSKKWQK